MWYLELTLSMSTMPMIVMCLIGGTNIFHLQHIAAFGTALDGTVARHLVYEQQNQWDRHKDELACGLREP